MRDKKNILRLFLLGLMLVLGLLGLHPSTASADTKASKKIISVVCDDSGSMAGDSWGQANYALQAFASLLNEQDEMYVTYMSQIDSRKSLDQISREDVVSIDMKSLQRSVDDIRAWPCGGGTPMDSIEVAMKKLQSIQDSDETTQYWLVVLTDGHMEGTQSGYTDLQEYLDKEIKGKTMPNGSSVYITYMGIGSATQIIGDSDAGFDAVNTSDIVEPLAQIANKISGRAVFDASAVTQVDKRTIKVQSELPLYSIALFSQRSNAVVSAAGNLTVNRNIHLQAPKSDGSTALTDSLYGNAAMITNSGNLIQPGEYTLTFSEDVELSNLVIMYQTAIEMQAILTRGGETVNDFALLFEGDSIDIEIQPINPETGAVIDEKDLPKGITWSIVYEVDGQVVAQADDNILKGLTIKSGDSRIICTMNIPDFSPQVQIFEFNTDDNIVYGIEVDQPGSFDQGDASYYRSDMGVNGCLGTPVKFYITGNGTRLTKDQLRQIDLEIVNCEWEAVSAPESSNVLEKFIIEFGFHDAVPKLQLNDDGSFELYPEAAPMNYLFIKGGYYTVTVQLDDGSGLSAEGKFAVIARFSDILILIRWLIAALILLYIILILTKKKFTRTTIYIDFYKSAQDGLGSGKKMTTQCVEKSVGPFSGDWLNPFSRHSSIQLGGFRFYANDIGGVEIKGTALRGAKAYGGSAVNPVENFDGLISGLKEVKGHEDKIPEVLPLGKVYVLQGKVLKKLYTE